ncbi:MAG TPA: sigma-E factor negative regulatory protein [Steroidobacteraceae bacterium]|nr:sigma-E factor negative regulatory protein [Steroidobacteraceae bacterium]
MSEQIREQVSAFLDGELPSSETELLLKRLTRETELRESFGRYALIGETMRGAIRTPLCRGFAARVNRAIDGEPATANALALRSHPQRWWGPIAGAAVAAGVAAVAVVALQQRAVAPSGRSSSPITVQNAAVPRPKEPVSYTVPATGNGVPTPLPAARLTSYVVAHSVYSTGLGPSNVLSGVLTATEVPAVDEQVGNETLERRAGAAASSSRAAAPGSEAARPPQPDPLTAP